MKIILSFVFSIMCVIGYSQFYINDTLFHKYAVRHLPLALEMNSQSGMGDKDFQERFYCSEDSIVDGEFFFAIGVCISTKEEPYYFIKISYLSMIDNWLYNNTKPVKVNIKMINEDYKSPNFLDNFFINSVSMQKEEWYALHYMGLDLKSNCNIFKLSALDAENIFKYNIGLITINRLDDPNITAGSANFNLSQLVEKFKNSIVVSSL